MARLSEFNQDVKQFLRLLVNQHQDDWYEWLSIAEFAHNDRVHTSKCLSPLLDTGQNHWLSMEPLRELHLETLNNFTSRMTAAMNEDALFWPRCQTTWAGFMMITTGKFHCKKQETRNGSMDRTSPQTVQWRSLIINDLVYLIEKVISQNAYRLKLPSSFGNVHPVFLVTLLKSYSANTISECIQKYQPPPIICNRIKEYKVDHILDSQMFWGKLEYLVHWKGYGIKEAKWRPAEDVKGSRWLVSEFLWGWHYDNATPTTRDTFNGQADRIWTCKHPGTLVILRDQAEEHPMCWVQVYPPLGRERHGQMSPYEP